MKLTCAVCKGVFNETEAIVGNGIKKIKKGDKWYCPHCFLVSGFSFGEEDLVTYVKADDYVEV